MLPGSDCCCEMLGAEGRWRGEDHQINIAGDDLLVGIEAGEATLGRDLVLRRKARIGRHQFGELLPRAGEVIGEELSHRGERHVLARGECIGDSTRSAAATPDHPDANRVGIGSANAEGAAWQGERGRSGASDLDEGTTIYTHGTLTRRMPGKAASDNHQRLFGTCGSVWFQVGSWRTLDVSVTAAAASRKEPPRSA